MTIKQKIRVAWYQSAREVLAAAMDIPLEELDGCMMECLDAATGKPTSIDVATLDDQPMWAFADTENFLIHAFAGPDVALGEVMRMIGHEIGHLVGTPCDDPIAEERRADAFGDVAALAYELTHARQP